ncbi:hypothetical protein SLS58_006128 [Diplodia intermedia]|uniref:Uncharacterized protein n=1 Tax=Diplodia intermedia TaxID=856260 RepID=A0ABR3TPB8_9PEZI
MITVRDLVNRNLPPPWDNPYQSGGGGEPPRKPNGSDKQGSVHGIDAPDVAPGHYCNTCGKEYKFRCACDCDHCDDHGHDNDLRELEEAQAHLNKITADLACTRAALDSARNRIVQIARRLGADPPPGLVQPRASSVTNSVASSNTLGGDADGSHARARARAGTTTSAAAATDCSSEWSISDHPAILAHLDAVPSTPRSQAHLGNRPNATSPQASWPATPEAPEEEERRWVRTTAPGIMSGDEWFFDRYEMQIANHASTSTTALPQPPPPPPPAYPHGLRHAARQPARPASPSPDNGWLSPVTAAHAHAPAPADPAADLASAWAPVAPPPPYWAPLVGPAGGSAANVDPYSSPVVNSWGPSGSGSASATTSTAAASGAGGGLLWNSAPPADDGRHSTASLTSSGAGGRLPPPPPYRSVGSDDSFSSDYDYNYEDEARRMSGWRPRRSRFYKLFDD